jgi:hypothetical protein
MKEEIQYSAEGDMAPWPDTREVVDGDFLWLWKNGDHYLAFRHEYPCFEPGGDPMTFGQPFGRAIFTRSYDRASRAPAAQPNVQPKGTSEPLTAEQCEPLIRDFQGQQFPAIASAELWFLRGIRAAEKAHGIVSQPPVQSTN